MRQFTFASLMAVILLGAGTASASTQQHSVMLGDRTPIQIGSQPPIGLPPLTLETQPPVSDQTLEIQERDYKRDIVVSVASGLGATLGGILGTIFGPAGTYAGTLIGGATAGAATGFLYDAVRQPAKPMTFTPKK